MKRKCIRLLPLLLFLGLAACGGGGGGGAVSTTGVWDTSMWDSTATWGT
jgi:hypothetical protein